MWTLTQRYADTVELRPRWRTNLAYRLTSRLQVGLEYNAQVSEAVPTANWVMLTASASRPMVSLGTSSDRIGSREGTHMHYLTIAKSIPHLPIAPYVSLNYSETDHAFNLPFGANIALHPQWDLLPMYDGKRTHILLTYKAERWNVTLMSVFLRRAGVSFGWAF